MVYISVHFGSKIYAVCVKATLRAGVGDRSGFEPYSKQPQCVCAHAQFPPRLLCL